MAAEPSEGRLQPLGELPKTEPGELAGIEWYKSGKLELSDEEKRALKTLVQKYAQRDLAARREQVIYTWKKRLYDRGFQHLLPQKNGGWQIPALGTGYNPQDDQYQRSLYTTNIYTPFGEIIQSALTREVPTPRFVPVDPEDDADITASQAAEKLKRRIENDDGLCDSQAEGARFLWTDGAAIYFSTYELDAQRFGFEPAPPAVVPEDEEQQDERDALDDILEETSEPAEENAEAVGASGEESGETDRGEPEETRKPRGREVIRVDGVLEWKFPIKANSLDACGYCQCSKEIDVQLAKAKYPDAADQIRPATGGPGGDDIDRLARINVRMGVMDNYNTTDSEVFDVTECKTFIRPGALLEIADQGARNSLMKKGGTKGIYVTFCGETFCEAYAESMDSHVTIIFARSGDGMNRPGLGDWLVPLQEIYNNWMELADDYIVRGVPQTWMDNEMFDVAALREQPNIPGATHPFEREPGVPMEQVIWREPVLEMQPELMALIEMVPGPLGQLLTGAMPALFGGDSGSEGVGDHLMQRDQALGRIGLAWRRIKSGMASVFEQAVSMLADNGEGTVHIVGSESVTVEIEDLRGNFRAVPVVDENFPETPTQKANRMAQLWADATANPTVADFVYNPDNLDLFKQSWGMEDLYLPQIDARDKQLGEVELLLKSGPVPNPKILEGQQQIKVLQQQMQAQMQNGNPEGAADLNGQIAQLTQQISDLPPEVSSVQIDPLCDDHATEASVCLRIINSPRGRELKNGTEEEKESFMNLRLHFIEHKQALAAQQAQQPPKGKPPSVSINLKDLPPAEAAEASNMAGIPAKAADFAAQEVATAAEKHPKDITGTGGVT